MLKSRFYKMLSWVLVLTIAITGVNTAPTAKVMASGLPAIFFEDDFSDGNYTDNPGWTAASGTWKISADPKDSGNYTLNQTDTGEGIITAGDIWTDFTVTMRFYTGAGQGYPGILARVQDSKNFYYFQMQKTSTLVLSKRVNGTDTTLKSASFAMSSNTWYTLKMALTGNVIKCYIVKDGTDTLLMEASDSTYSSGKIGIRNKWQSVYLDDVKVTEAPAVNTAVLRSDSQTSSSVALSWDAIENAASYNIYRSVTAGSGYTYLGNTVTNAYVDTGLTFDTTYYYKMTYLYGGITESRSTEEFAVTTASAPPASPAEVTASAMNSSQIKLSWNKVTKADGYRIYRVVSGSAIAVYEGNDLTYTDTGLFPATTYNYNISAYNAAGESEPFSLKATTYRYDAPSNFLAVDVTDSSVLLSWDPITDNSSAATGAAIAGTVVSGPAVIYTVTRSTSSYGTYSQVYSGSDTTFTDTGLIQGTAYFYKLTATIGVIISAESDPLNVSTVRTSFTPDTLWVDTSGKAIDAHGAGIMYDKNSGKYYWYGEYHAGTWPGSGVKVYSSTDLYNWTDEGMALTMIPSMESFTEDSYISQIYAGRTDLENIFESMRVGRIVERPKVIYNENTGKYVMWMHMEGYTNADGSQNTSYGKAQAGVAVSDSPTGPFEYIDDYRLDICPADQTDYFPSSKGMARDMNLFKDDDGTAYIIYSSEENLTIYISKLTDDYLDITGWHKDNLGYDENGVPIRDTAYKAVYGEDYTRVFPGAQREAPAMFKYNGKYYLLTSGATGWSANENKYTTADDIFGTWQTLANPFVRTSSTDPNPSKAFNSQTTCIIPVDPENGKFIYVGDDWNGGNFANDSAKYLFLPIDFGQGTDMTIKWYSSWTLYALDNAAGISVQTKLPETYMTGATLTLPDQLQINTNGTDMVTPVTWTYNSTDLNGSITFDFPGLYTLQAVLPDLNNKTVSYKIYSIPDKTLYFVNCSGYQTVDYSLIASYMQDTLYNTGVIDQEYNDAEAKPWGYEGTNTAISGSSSGDLFSTLRYLNAGNSSSSSAGKDLNYKFTVENGTYTVYTGFNDIWSNSSRTADLYINENKKSAITFISNKVYKNEVEVTDGTIEITVRNTASQDPLINWIMITNDALSHDTYGGLKLSENSVISWNKVIGAMSYTLYRSEDSDGTYVPVYTGSDTTFTDAILDTGKCYYYKVSCTVDGIESALSAPYAALKNILVQTPIISTEPDNTNNLSNDQVVDVTLTTATTVANIYYTMDNADPNINSSLYNGPFEVKTDIPAGETVTIKAIAVLGDKISQISQKTLTFLPAATEVTPSPTLSPTPTITPEPTLSPEPTSSPEPTISPVPTSTPEPTISPVPTSTPEPTTSPVPTSSPEPTISPVPTSTPEPSITPSPTTTPTPTSKPKPTKKPSVITPTPVTERVSGSKNSAPVTIVSSISNARLQVSVTVSDNDVLKMLEKASEKNPLPVQIQVTTKTVMEELKSTSNSGADITVYVSQNILSNKAIQNLDIHVDAEILETARIYGKDLNIIVKDELGKVLYNWNFNKNNLKNSKKKIGDINLTLSVIKVKDTEEICKLFGNGTANSENVKYGIVVKFNHDGILPAQASVRIYIGKLFSDLGKDTSFYIYHYNPSQKRLEALPVSSGYKVDDNGYITLDIIHGSDYVLLPEVPESGLITSLVNQISITPELKTLYVQGTKGKTTEIKITLPSTLELVSSLSDSTSGSAAGAVVVSYKSQNKKIAVVDKNGKITAKSAGSTKIITTITLFNGEKVSYATTVKVKKPYVKF